MTTVTEDAAGRRERLRELLKTRAADRFEQHPAGVGQRALWFLHQTQPDSPAYNTAFAFRSRATLETAVLRRTLATLSIRHAALRTTFAAPEGRPVQEVRGYLEVPLRVHRTDGYDRAELERVVNEVYAEPFDLSGGPLVRVDLFSSAVDDHVVLLTLHHAVCDAWSLWILADELVQLYQGETVGQPPALAPVTAYHDFCRSQKALLESAAGERLWQYWRTTLAGDLPTLELPLDHPRPPVRALRGGTIEFSVPADLSRALRATAARLGSTLYTVLLGCFQLLLHRFSGQRELVIGTLTAGRTDPAFTGAVGYFVNPVVMRSRLPERGTVADFLGDVRQAVLGAVEHQDFPFPLLVERLQPDRDSSRSPLFQVLFVLQKAPRQHGPEQLGSPDGSDQVGLRLEPFPVRQMEGQFDITLEMTDADQVTGCLKYATPLFERATAARMIRYLVPLLRDVCADPGRGIGQLVGCDLEDRSLIDDRNATTTPQTPVDRRVHHLIAERARESPDAVALLLDADDGTPPPTCSYGVLERRATRLARRLRAHGVGPDVLVGVLLPRSVDLLVAVVAVLKAGGAFVPIDPEHPPRRIDEMLRDAGGPVLLATAELASQLSLPAGCLLVVPDAIETAGEEIEAVEAGGDVGDAGPDGLAYVIYTSGSTGRPKAAMNTHRGLLNRLDWMQRTYQLDETDTVLQKTPVSFDVSVWELLWPLTTGARLALCPPGRHRDPRFLADLIARQQVTTVHFVPSMLRVLLDTPGLPSCPGLRRIICSGEALSPALATQCLSAFDAELHNLYGPAEAAIDVTFWPCQLDRLRDTVPIGRPIANSRIHVVDSRFRRCPVGVAGELCIAGVGVGRGYHARPGLTAERYVPDPFGAPGARLYRTGDRARWRWDGELEYLGRFDHQVKIRGVRIELGEVEARLMDHPGVRQSVVDVRSGPDGADRLVAYLVADPPHPSVTALHRSLAESLPDTMRPAVFLFLDQLPLSPAGKLDRRLLPDPPADRPHLDSAYAVPRTDTERQVAAVWQTVLGVEAVGVHDNFFELGGHSLALAEVQARLSKIGDRPLSVVDLFRLPTVAMLAEHLTGATARSDQAPARSAERLDRRTAVAAGGRARVAHRLGRKGGV